MAGRKSRVDKRTKATACSILPLLPAKASAENDSDLSKMVANFPLVTVFDSSSGVLSVSGTS